LAPRIPKQADLNPRILLEILHEVTTGRVPKKIHLNAEIVAFECGADGITSIRNYLEFLGQGKKYNII